MSAEHERKLSQADIFNHLLELGREKLSYEGVVAACVVRDGKILASAPSLVFGIVIHAEHNVLGYLYQKGLKIEPEDILYTTLEPCTGRFDSTIGIQDCSTIIFASGIKHVVYGASDPIQSELTHKRFEAAGVKLEQIQDEEIIKRCKDLFNTTRGDYKI